MMDDLEYISAGDISEEVPTSSIVSRTFFPSLKSLTIEYCRKLKGWWRRRDFVLWITNCDNFKSLSDIDDDDDGGMEWRHLNCLQSLRFESLIKLESLPVGLQHVATLQKLIISACPNLISLPEWICELTLLEHLVIARCASKLTSIPAGISCLTSLRVLTIVDFPNLMTLPESICNLTSLEELEIVRCPNLTALPDGMHYLKSLQKLRIVNCPCLKKRCKKEIGEDWPKITHMLMWLSFSSWLCSLINLVDLTIESCKRCQHLPLLSQIPFLERLVLSMMDDLEYISAGDISEEVPTSSIVSRTFFPSLKSLTIEYCRKLKGWWRRRDFVVSTPDHDHSHHQYHPSLPSFPRLSFLLISECPNLTFMPLFPYLEEQLYLDNVSWKPLQQTMTMASSLPSSSSSPLSRLKSDMESLPNEWASNLNFLKNLVIINCPGLSSLSRAMQYLTSLEELWITNCDEFKSLSDIDDDDGMEWRHLNCLRSLRFESLLKLESLPAGLQHVATLQKLIISACPNLISLPEWICELTSLEHLVIARCASKLTSLPAGISCLTSLRVLTIADFPNLMTLPESICNLTSLEEFEIVRCPNLTALPDGMHYLKSLQKLRIVGMDEDCLMLATRLLPHLKKLTNWKHKTKPGINIYLEPFQQVQGVYESVLLSSRGLYTKWASHSTYSGSAASPTKPINFVITKRILRPRYHLSSISLLGLHSSTIFGCSKMQESIMI
ncbi:putative disease resistance protein rga4 [Quercus suber]|uniref:Disease resistance protein rga4 n=1 Tax=Quercus suber TaxID=58331 RepID=A0AAW0LJ04_QUESU